MHNPRPRNQTREAIRDLTGLALVIALGTAIIAWDATVNAVRAARHRITHQDGEHQR